MNLLLDTNTHEGKPSVISMAAQGPFGDPEETNPAYFIPFF